MIVPQNIKDKVEARIDECVSIARKRFPDRSIPTPIIKYTLRGQTAGTANATTNVVNFNSILLVENEDRFIGRTVGHEAAHMIDKAVYGFQFKNNRGRRVRDSHGKTWKSIMRLLGQEPSRCHSYDVTNSKVKKAPRTKHIWTCGCGGAEMDLGSKRHANQKQGNRTYWIRGHSPSRCGKYKHTHDLIKGRKVEVSKVQIATPVAPRAKMPKAGTKMASAVALVQQLRLPRKSMINYLAVELNMSYAGAQTYYYNAKKVLGI